MSLNKVLSKLFFWFGGYVHDFWYVFILVPCVLTGLLSVGFLYMEQRIPERIERIFVPYNGRWVHEKKVIADLWPLDQFDYKAGKNFEPKFWCDLKIVVKTEDGNMLDEEYADVAEDIDEYIRKKLEIQLPDTNYTLRYADLCLKSGGNCHHNSVVKFLKSIDDLGAYFDLTYPRADVNKTPTYVANLLGGVTLKDAEGHLESVKALRLLYYLQEEPEVVGQMSREWLNKLADYVTGFESDLLEITLFHTYSLHLGMMLNADRLIPKFALAMVVLIAFAIFSSFTFLKVPGHWVPFVVDWRRSRPNLAMGGVITAGFGVVSGMGSLLLTGIVGYHTIIAIMPFLIISIGVDDMFIMLAAWRRTPHIACQRTRLQTVLAESAVSITITSVTDALSFGIGAISTVPAVTSFCIYTTICILFTYLYQITFFAGLLVLVGRRELANRHCIMPNVKTEPMEMTRDHTMKLLFRSGFGGTPDVPAPGGDHKSSEMDDYDCPEEPISGFLGRHFAPFLLNTVNSVVFLLSFGVYLGFALYGLTRIREGLEPKAIIDPQFYVTRWYELSEQYFWAEGTVLQVIVSRSTNLSDRRERDKMLAAVRSLEGTERTMNSNATHFWLRDYLKYLGDIAYNVSSSEIDNAEIWGSRLYYWATQGNGKSAWSDDIVWKKINDTNEGFKFEVKAFRLRVGLRNFKKPKDHRAATQLVRSIGDRYPEYDISEYHIWFPYADQYIIILPNTLQNIGIALVCMVVIAFLLIPDVFSSCLVTLSIVSIDVGVIGYMALWDVNLDAISMITVIMSIGFAVDLSAHITYAFTISPGSPDQKVSRALAELGVPVLQGGLTTIFGVLQLSSIDAYSTQVFFKNVFLVISIGLLHGMIYLPIFLCYGTKLRLGLWGCSGSGRCAACGCCGRNRNRIHDTNGVNSDLKFHNGGRLTLNSDRSMNGIATIRLTPETKKRLALSQTFSKDGVRKNVVVVNKPNVPDDSNRFMNGKQNGVAGNRLMNGKLNGTAGSNLGNGERRQHNGYANSRNGNATEPIYRKANGHQHQRQPVKHIARTTNGGRGVRSPATLVGPVVTSIELDDFCVQTVTLQL